jgi:hypothetical protein
MGCLNPFCGNPAAECHAFCSKCENLMRAEMPTRRRVWCQSRDHGRACPHLATTGGTFCATHAELE